LLSFRPIHTSDKDMTGKIVPIKPDAQPKRRVLVVEDNIDSMRSMVMLIKMMGHDVEFAINGFAALDIAKTFKPEVVLLDIGLPDFTGDKIARQIKYEPGLERTRIIAVTGLPLSQIQERALQAGCEAVYAKPLAPTTLEELLDKPSLVASKK